VPSDGELVVISGRDLTGHAGGAESYMTAIALCARSVGLEPQVFVTGRRSERVGVEFGTLHRVRSLASQPPSHMAIVHRPVVARAVVEFLRGRPGAHVIQSHAGWTNTACAAAARLRREGVQVRVLASMYAAVAHEQGAKLESELVRSQPHWRLKYRLLTDWVRAVAVREERAGYLGADAVTVNYENVRRLLCEAYGERPMQRIAYCAPLAFRSGPTFAERPATPAPGRAPLIVAISRHAPRKGLDVLLRALALLRMRGVQFRAQLAGDGPIHGGLRQLAHQLGLADQVEWPGVVPDPLPYLQECEVFALPTIAEDSGSMSVLEALQAGAPIVCSEVDGLPEDLTNEHDALLVPPRDPRALADALARLLGDQQLRGRLSRNARATYEARFAPGPAAADLAGVYRSLGLEASTHAARVQ
jgi:glycosyltransferase involved in cell wall biosynthesis